MLVNEVDEWLEKLHAAKQYTYFFAHLDQQEPFWRAIEQCVSCSFVELCGAVDGGCLICRCPFSVCCKLEEVE